MATIHTDHVPRRRGRPRRQDCSGTAFATVEIVARACGLAPAALVSRSRLRYYAEARQIVFWLLREAGLSYPQIGAALDRHHATVMHGVAEVEADSELRALARRILLREDVRQEANWRWGLPAPYPRDGGSR